MLDEKKVAVARDTKPGMPEERKPAAPQDRKPMTRTAVIILWDGVLLVPMYGVIDTKRAQEAMETILQRILQTGARTVILDILGVASVDTGVANHLIKIVKACRLMGSTCIISGMSPAIAQTVVELGVDLGDIVTRVTLRDAIQLAFKLTGWEVREIKEAKREVKKVGEKPGA